MTTSPRCGPPLEKAQARAAAAEAEAARALAQNLQHRSPDCFPLRLEIEKLRREIYGQRSGSVEARLLEQMEFQLEELEATASEDELAAKHAAARTLAGQIVHPPEVVRASRSRLICRVSAAVRHSRPERRCAC